MAKCILLLESSKLHSASLKARLESLGLEVLAAASKADLSQALSRPFDLAIADSVLSGCEGAEHLEMLKAIGKPVWLWSDDEALLGDSSRQIGYGIAKSYRKLNRADLIHACEALFKKLGAADEPPRNFLLVEDSPTVRAYVRRVLEDRFPASSITEAEDGKTAIAAMKNSRVDLIVTDLQMPGMDGSSFVQVLRGNPVLAKKPIVILSGMITAKVREEMAGMPRLRFLPKPASPDSVEQAVRGLLADAGAEV